MSDRSRDPGAPMPTATPADEFAEVFGPAVVALANRGRKNNTAEPVFVQPSPTPDQEPHMSDTTTMPDQAESEQILDQLQKLAAGGAIDYVLPTTPLGEEWIVGHQGEIIKMAGNGEAAAFLAGSTVGMLAVARLAGLRLPD